MSVKRALVVVLLAVSPGMARADYLEDVGYNALLVLLGGSTPDGTGVSVTQVEADLDGVSGSPYLYLPNTADSQFTGITFTDVSALSGAAVSSHATAVGQYFYGNNAMASGISSVANYEANNWLQSGYLRYNFSSQAPLTENRDIQNHSWVGSTGNATIDTSLLNRLDYAIERDDFVAVVGTPNSGGSSTLLSNSYNTLNVGLSNGTHGAGTTTVNGTGRLTVHLVAPDSATSFATAKVSSAAALLIDQARDSGNANADHSEVVKAVMLAGATKSEFATWDRTSTRPLDETYGAGELNVLHNYQIMAGGEQESGTGNVALTGWDFDAITSAATQTYYLELAGGSMLSIALNWNQHLTPTDPPGPSIDYNTMITSLANLDLQLWKVDEVGTLLALVDESVSTLENIEHIWQQSLNAGRYAIIVSSGSSTSWDYALAWQTTAIPEPETVALLLLGGAGLFLLRRRSRS
jgi:hypothetical protein